MQRTWTTVAERNVERLGGRAAVERAIAGLEWKDVSGGVTVGAFQGLAIDKAVSEYGIPRVSHIATTGLVGAPDEEGDGFYPDLLGIRGHYANGRADVYVLDTGTALQTVCSDFYEEAADAVAC